MRHVLFLCTGNSARSILAEATLNALGEGAFAGFSAGSQPKTNPHPMAIETLARHGHSIQGLSSKSWEAFAGPGAREMHAIITVCDNAAGETCPVWPGHPVSAHWGVPDPAAVVGDDDEKRWAFGVAYTRLRSRIEDMLVLDWERLSNDELKAALAGIGQRHRQAESASA